MNIKLTGKSASWLLAAVIAARSSTYMFSKLLLGSMSSSSMLTYRFMIAFCILLVLFWRKLKELDRKALLHGTILGLMFTAVMFLNLTSLKYCSSSMVSFLVNTAVVLVPIINAAVTRKSPERKTVIGSLTALAGIAVLTLSSSETGTFKGIVFALLSALLYSLTIFTTGRFSKSSDPLLVGIVQVGVIGLSSLLVSISDGSLSLEISPVNWIYILFLALVCSCFGYTLQPVCQRHVDTDTAGMLCAINPLFAAVLGLVFLNERLTPVTLAGSALIVCGIMLPHLKTKSTDTMKILRRHT